MRSFTVRKCSLMFGVRQFISLVQSTTVNILAKQCKTDAGMKTIIDIVLSKKTHKPSSNVSVPKRNLINLSLQQDR